MLATVGMNSLVVTAAFANAKLGVPLYIGWAALGAIIILSLSIMVLVVRFHRWFSPIFRFLRVGVTVLVLSGGLGQFALGAFAQYDAFRNSYAKNIPTALAYCVNYMTANDFQGVGLAYLLLFYFCSRRLKKWERDAVSAAPLQVGDTRLRAASEQELTTANVLRPNGSYLCLFSGKVIRIEFADRLIVAPQGTGKGVSVIIPALLSEHRPIICLDMKAENLAVTCSARARLGGNRPWRTLYVLDPYGISTQPGFVDPDLSLTGLVRYARVNVLDMVDIANHARADRDMDIAVDCLCLPIRDDADDAARHFHDLARTVIRGIVWAGKWWQTQGATENGRPIAVHPGWVRDVVVRTNGNFDELTDWLSRSGRYGLEASTALRSAGDRERGSIFTSLTNTLSWLGDVNMYDACRTTTISVDMVTQGLADVFIVCPPDQAYAKRMWVQGLLRFWFTHLEKQPTEKRPPRDILFLLDEMGQFGYLKPVEEAFTRLRGYGGRIWAVFQNVGQMKAYTDAAFLKSAAVTQVFGTTDQDTLAWVAAMAGKRRILQTQVQEGANAAVLPGSRDAGVQSGRSITETEADTLTVDVIRGLGNREALAFVTGLSHPLLYEQTPYYKAARLFPHARPNPMEAYRLRTDAVAAW